MKLSIVILCWNDLKVIPECLRSLYATTRCPSFEVIVSDNGSTDGTLDFIRANYPQVQLIENGRNLRFAKANNVGIRACHGEYILILNPDTIIHEGALDKMIEFADAHKAEGAFGCRVLNADGSYQISAQPFPSLHGDWIVALYLRWLGYLGDWFAGDTYAGWKGDSVRRVDWISGCFMLIRGEILKQVGGFDERFFYYYEDTDLCRKIQLAGWPILFNPDAVITHLKGQSTSQRLPPVAFALDGQVTRYLYYYKYDGKRGVRQARWIALVSLAVRRLGYGLVQLVKPTEFRKARLELLRAVSRWTYALDPVRLVEHGEEPRAAVNLPGRVVER